MSGKSDPSGLQGPAGDSQVVTRFLIYVDGEYFDVVREVLSSINAAMASFGTHARVGVAVPIGAYTLTGSRKLNDEEKKTAADIMENALRESLTKSGKDWPITVKAETGVA